jgi:hypothetical protein
MLKVVFFWKKTFIIRRDTYRAVKSDATIPKISVTANPLIGPVPFHSSIKAVISVVRLESIIVTNAFEYPVSIALLTVFPSLSS